MNQSSGSQLGTTQAFSAGRFVPPTPQELAAMLPNLDVLEFLGHGGMGAVYKGRQPLLDRLVAIKILRPDFGGNTELHARFVQEARMLARLRHPYIVTVFDIGKTGDFVYLVMEFVEGVTLRQRQSSPGLTERDALDFVPQLTEALEHAHDLGVVHRDVKPENVLVDRLGRVRLVDFGLASLLGPEDPSANPGDQVVGTLGYMAPEQITAPHSVDHRADVYSLGVVFYEMLTGRLPKTDRPLPSVIAGTDQRLDPVALRAIEPQRENRYQQARDLRTDLLAISRTPQSTVRIEHEVTASPEELFAAWTDPTKMGDWYAPTDDFSTPIAEVDLNIGGQYRIGMLPPGAADVRIVTGQYCRLEPPHCVSFTWAWPPPHADVHETQVTIELQPRGSSTNVVLTHERFRDEHLRNEHAKGWSGCLSRLARKFKK